MLYDCYIGAFCGKRIDKVHKKQTVRVLDTEYGPWMVACPLPLFAGEHNLLVPSSSHPFWFGNHRISDRS